jgi:hypothetical protein
MEKLAENKQLEAITKGFGMKVSFKEMVNMKMSLGHIKATSWITKNMDMAKSSSLKALLMTDSGKQGSLTERVNFVGRTVHATLARWIEGNSTEKRKSFGQMAKCMMVNSIMVNLKDMGEWSSNKGNRSFISEKRSPMANMGLGLKRVFHTMLVTLETLYFMDLERWRCPTALIMKANGRMVKSVVRVLWQNIHRNKTCIKISEKQRDKNMILRSLKASLTTIY